MDKEKYKVLLIVGFSFLFWMVVHARAMQESFFDSKQYSCKIVHENAPYEKRCDNYE